MFKTKGGGGQRLFEQCSKKLRIWYRLAPLIVLCGATSLIEFYSIPLKGSVYLHLWVMRHGHMAEDCNGATGYKVPTNLKVLLENSETG